MQEWEKEGLDQVELAEYDFYLSWPNSTNPNYIRLLDENGNHEAQNKYISTFCTINNMYQNKNEILLCDLIIFIQAMSDLKATIKKKSSGKEMTTRILFTLLMPTLLRER